MFNVTICYVMFNVTICYVMFNVTICYVMFNVTNIPPSCIRFYKSAEYWLEL